MIFLTIIKRSKLCIALMTVIITVAFFGNAVTNRQAYAKQVFVHGFSYFGDLKYLKGFKNFNYINPNAPKGGKVTLGSLGTFDSFNAFIVQGTTPPGLGLIYDTLTVSSQDEIFSVYGHLAESMLLAKDKKSMIFRLRKNLKWHDGKAITSEDVVWSYKTALRENGLPSTKEYLKDIKTIRAINNRDILFTFKTNNNTELHLIIGSAVLILPKHFWKDKDIEKPLTTKPLGSGAYEVASFSQNDHITYKRVKNYWGNNTATSKGFNNFDEINYIFFEDRSVMREAVKAKTLDFFVENTAKEWVTGYDIEAVQKGELKLEAIPDQTPKSMQGFYYNVRKETLKNIHLREALAYALDFDWLNKTLFYNQYKRSRSFFGAKGMEASALPDKDELALLQPFKNQLSPRVFTEIYNAPTTGGDPKVFRENLKHGLSILTKAGYSFEKGLLYDKSGKVVSLEILLYDPSFDRIALPFKKNASRLGVQISIKRVGAAEYINKIKNQDFDIIIWGFRQSFSPGNEQYDYWGSENANVTGTQNITGIHSPVIDSLISSMVKAKNRKELETATRALDRVLQFQFITIPHWYVDSTRLVYKNIFGKPKPNLRGSDFMAWWINKSDNTP